MEEYNNKRENEENKITEEMNCEKPQYKEADNSDEYEKSKNETDDEISSEEIKKLQLPKPDKKSVKGFFIGVAATIAAIVIGFNIYLNLPIGYSASSPTSLSTYKKITEATNIINKYYMGDVDEQLVTDYMFLGLVSGLEDQYSTYYTKEQYEALSTYQQGEYVGVGITIAVRADDGEVEITDVTEDGPADTAGIQIGDLIRSVNGTETEGMTSSEVSALVQNAEDDDIVFGIYREDTEEELEITVTRDTLEYMVVSGGIIEEKIGYIAINSFKGVTAEQFADVLEQIGEYDVEGLIIDLRGNPGGLVSAACDTLRELIPEGVLVYTEDKNGNQKEYTSESGNEIDLPMVVLVDEETASAAEIVSGALQDYGIATIVGSQTYGKGIVQDVFRLSDGSVLRLTVSHYYTPYGNNIHEVGITPDIVVEDDEDTETDEQLAAALEVFGAELSE